MQLRNMNALGDCSTKSPAVKQFAKSIVQHFFRDMSNSNQEIIEARLATYVDGELDPAERIEIEAHLEQNPQYRRLVDELRQMREMLRSLPRETLAPVAVISTLGPARMLRVGRTVIESSLKCAWAVFITRLVISTFSRPSTVLPRAWRITSPTLKSSK